jgi:hypothetical protein
MAVDEPATRAPTTMTSYGGQLGHQGVPLHGGPGGPFLVVPAVGLLDLLLEVEEAGPDLVAGAVVQHLVGTQPQVDGHGRLARGRGDQLRGRDRPGAASRVARS